jgi:hypothetical protein
VCLDTADVVRDEPIILKNKIEELRDAGAVDVFAGQALVAASERCVCVLIEVNCSLISQSRCAIVRS